MSNEQILIDNVFNKLHDKLHKEDFVIDKSGVKLVELIAPRLEFDPTQPTLNFNGRKTPENYCKREVEWYDSKELSVYKIPGKTPKVWIDVSSYDGHINSNYGWCIYSDENYNQYDNALKTLINDRETRRSCMIYTRPNIQVEYNKDGMSDFICTFSTQQFIRNNKLEYLVSMRSQDGIFGFFNDFYWHCVVYDRLFTDLKKTYPELEVGKIIWIANSFHIYERHFEMLEQIVS